MEIGDLRWKECSPIRGAQLLARQDLLTLRIAEGTETHRPIPHAKVVEALIESLGLRHMAVVEGQLVEVQYSVTPDGDRMFGVLSLDVE